MKGWLWLILVPVLVFVRDLFLNDLTAWTLSSLAAHVVRFHAARLPSASSARYLDEWNAELREIQEPTRKLAFALGLFWGMNEIRDEAVSAEREGARTAQANDVTITIPSGSLTMSGQVPAVKVVDRAEAVKVVDHVQVVVVNPVVIPSATFDAVLSTTTMASTRHPTRVVAGSYVRSTKVEPLVSFYDVDATTGRIRPSDST